MADVEPILSINNELGEGPLWNAAENKLYWVDILLGHVHRVTPGETGYETFALGQPIGSMGLRARGGFVVALKHGIHFWTPGSAPELVVDPEADRPHSRFNDGKVDRRGRFWSGTMDDNGQSALYRFDPDGSLHVMETGITCSNGIGWSPDNRTMYYTDSQVKTVYAYDFDLDSGEIGNRRVFLKAENRDPDGLTVDAEGGIWVAFWGGWCVERYDPDGFLVARIDMPVEKVTCPTFGGANFDELYVTSAVMGASPEHMRRYPLTGDLFRIHSGVKGLPEPTFAG